MWSGFYGVNVFISTSIDWNTPSKCINRTNDLTLPLNDDIRLLATFFLAFIFFFHLRCVWFVRALSKWVRNIKTICAIHTRKNVCKTITFFAVSKSFWYARYIVCDTKKLKKKKKSTTTTNTKRHRQIIDTHDKKKTCHIKEIVIFFASNRCKNSSRRWKKIIQHTVKIYEPFFFFYFCVVKYWSVSGAGQAQSEEHHKTLPNNEIITDRLYVKWKKYETKNRRISNKFNCFKVSNSFRSLSLSCMTSTWKLLSHVVCLWPTRWYNVIFSNTVCNLKMTHDFKFKYKIH